MFRENMLFRAAETGWQDALLRRVSSVNLTGARSVGASGRGCARGGHGEDRGDYDKRRQRMLRRNQGDEEPETTGGVAYTIRVCLGEGWPSFAAARRHLAPEGMAVIRTPGHFPRVGIVRPAPRLVGQASAGLNRNSALERPASFAVHQLLSVWPELSQSGAK